MTDDVSSRDPAARLAILAPDGMHLAAVGPDPMTIGREEGCTLVLESLEVSRVHCRLEQLPTGRHRVVDLESSNGVMVNGRRVTRAALLPFDRIQVGDHELVYLDPRTDVEQVLEVLDPADEVLSLRPPGEASLRESLIQWILTLQELRDEEDLEPLLDALFDELLRAGFSRAMVLLQDPPSPSGLLAAKLRNAPPDHVRAEALEPYRAVVERLLAEDGVSVERTPLEPAGRTVCVPIRSHMRPRRERRRFQTGSVNGALLLGTGSADLDPTPDERRLLRALARQVGILLSSARLQRQATVDALTSLANRAETERILREELERVHPGGTALAVLLIDLDDFKRVNDTHGHATGDEVLRELALRLRRSIRLTDSAGRWGGEEFMAVLPGADLLGASRVADEFLDQLRATPIAGLPMTASVGIACHPDHGADPALLVRRADLALYRAKSEGKDRAVSFRRELELEGMGGQTRRLSRIGLDRDLPAVAWLVGDCIPPTPLVAGETTLGRARGSSILLPHPEVSRTHGLLETTPEGGLRYRDRSTNGTLLNGTPIEGCADIAPGDQLQVGPWTLRIEPHLLKDPLLDETRPLETIRAP